ncbi:MAG: preprotein translocase subunit SecE [Bdellovibrionaceae bacterium]|jgi:preprotein translocase subunit SecE|nr:preprotein translocase subunit SecE [Pseudobdellovibrionaceae bacterium]
MNEDNKKIITLSFVIAGFLTFLVVRVFFQSLAVSFGIVGKYWAMTSIQHAVPVGTGILMFAVLQFNTKIMYFADECVVEIKKVVWPSRKDTIAMTIVTCVMVVIASIVLGVFDFTSGSAIKAFIY